MRMYIKIRLYVKLNVFILRYHHASAAWPILQILSVLDANRSRTYTTFAMWIGLQLAPLVALRHYFG